MLVPKVSICIPAYNNVNEVKRLLESIFLQRFKNYEIILTDDSTNNEISELDVYKRQILRRRMPRR